MPGPTKTGLGMVGVPLQTYESINVDVGHLISFLPLIKRSPLFPYEKGLGKCPLTHSSRVELDPTETVSPTRDFQDLVQGSL